MKKYTHIDLARKKMGDQAFMIFFCFYITKDIKSTPLFMFSQ